jgi:hypothetical protein
VFGRSLYDVTKCRNWIPDWSFASRRSFLFSSKTKVACFNNLCTHSDFHKRNESHWVPVSSHERCSLRDTKTHQTIYAAVLGQRLVECRNRCNKQEHVHCPGQAQRVIGRSSGNTSVLTVIKERQPCRCYKSCSERPRIDISPMSRPRTTQGPTAAHIDYAPQLPMLP